MSGGNIGKQAIEAFMDACGMAGPLVLDVDDRHGQRVQRHAFHQPFVVIGRTPDADLRLDDEQVSRRHVYFQVVAGRVYCIDLDSRTGIHWDDRTYGSGWMDMGRTLQVGSHYIRLRGGVARRPSESADRLLAGRDRHLNKYSQWMRHLPRVVLEFPERGVVQPPWRMNRMLALVGRSSECKVLLSGADVSLFHCSLIRTAVGVWVVDLLGRQGTFVNGRPIRYAALEHGDELLIGQYRILLGYGSTAGVRPVALSAHRGDEPASESETAASPRWPGRPAPPSSRNETPAERRAPAPLMFDPTLAALPPGDMKIALPVPVTPPPLPAIGTLMAGRPQEHVELAESLLVPLVHQFGQMQQQMFDQFQQTTMMMLQMFASMHRDQMAVVREELDQIRRLSEQLSELQKQMPAQPDTPTATPAAMNQTTPAPQEPVSKRTPGGSPPPRSEADEAQWKNSPPPTDLHAQLARRIASLQEERQSRWKKLLTMVTGGRPPTPSP